MELYQEWLEKAEEQDVVEELRAIAGNEKEIEDRFYKELTFGTGGLRGVIGAGTNRMNAYTVGRATLGLAEYILKTGAKKSVVIAYDSRFKSREFAFRIADILSSKGITAYVFDKLTPTPVLSYAVRTLQTGAGIVITASHNPKEYNGYKVYNDKGCQITDEVAVAILSEIEKSEYFFQVEKKPELIKVLGDEILDEFLEKIREFSLSDIAREYPPKVVYTPLHGTGNVPVRKLLEKMGVLDVTVVKEQELPDSEFTTCPYPNPEEKEALNLALEKAKEIGAELVLATDPDADRVGIAVPDKDGYRLLNGNETGVLMMEYMLSAKAKKGVLGANPTIIKTIVTTDMAFGIAKAYGANVKEVLTGFKYIGEALDKTENYVMGLEESYGYLVGDHARDKDAVSAVMTIVEMCAYYKSKGQGVVEALENLYKTYGYYQTELASFQYPGKAGMATMSAVIDKIRNNPPTEILGKAVEFTDFSQGVDGLPKSDVLRFRNDELRLIVRPSGTEPKLKIYYQVKGETGASADAKMQALIGFSKQRLFS